MVNDPVYCHHQSLKLFVPVDMDWCQFETLKQIAMSVSLQVWHSALGYLLISKPKCRRSLREKLSTPLLLTDDDVQQSCLCPVFQFNYHQHCVKSKNIYARLAIFAASGSGWGEEDRTLYTINIKFYLLFIWLQLSLSSNIILKHREVQF